METEHHQRIVFDSFDLAFYARAGKPKTYQHQIKNENMLFIFHFLFITSGHLAPPPTPPQPAQEYQKFDEYQDYQEYQEHLEYQRYKIASSQKDPPQHRQQQTPMKIHIKSRTHRQLCQAHSRTLTLRNTFK